MSAPKLQEFKSGIGGIGILIFVLTILYIYYTLVQL